MTSISAPGGSIIYLTQSGGTISYSGAVSGTITSWPVTFNNTDVSPTSYLKIYFTTNITLTSGTDRYFECGSEYIQIGNDQLNTDGTQTVITIDGITNYPGLVKNDSNSNIIIQNIGINSINGSTTNGGWLCASAFASGSTNNQIINCYSNGDIATQCGGICGFSVGRNSGNLAIINCYSTGTIGSSAGGICGANAGFNSGTVVVTNSYSIGEIGTDGGGIFGLNAGNNSGNVTAENCYSTGNLGAGAGGIYGQGAGSVGSETCSASNCYSTGNMIGNNSGGIFGELCAIGTNSSITAINCYSIGIISGSGAGGIYGANTNRFSASGAIATVTNCFMKSSGNIIGSSSIATVTNSGSGSGSWSDSTVATYLTGVPSSTDVGTTWSRTDGVNTPFKLITIGYSPYSRSLTRTYSQIINVGESSAPAIVTGHTFKILAINGSSPSTYPGITINTSTGAISIASTVTSDTYSIIVYDYINPYAITTVEVEVNGQTIVIPSYCCPVTTNANFPEYEIKNNITDYKGINYDEQNYGRKVFNSYSDYIKYKMTRNYICN